MEILCEENTAQKIQRAVRFGHISEEALTEHEGDLLRRLKAGELRMPKPDQQRDDIVAKLARLQGQTFSRTDAAYPRDKPKPRGSGNRGHSAGADTPGEQPGSPKPRKRQNRGQGADSNDSETDSMI